MNEQLKTIQVQASQISKKARANVEDKLKHQKYT